MYPDLHSSHSGRDKISVQKKISDQLSSKIIFIIEIKKIKADQIHILIENSFTICFFYVIYMYM